MATTSKPQVGILRGSESDRAQMKGAADVLAEFGIGCDVRMMLAHRNSEDVAEFSPMARERGLRMIIAGVGGLAYLTGCGRV